MPLRTVLIVAGVIVGVLAVVVAVAVGLQGASRPDGPPTVAATGPLVLPATVADYARDPTQPATPSIDPTTSQNTVTAAYSRGGRSQFLAIASRPASDAEAVMNELQATNVRPVGVGVCGRTRERLQDACAVVTRGTAVVVVTEVAQTQDEMVSLAQRIGEAL